MIYAIETSEVLKVSGTFELIGEFQGLLYVEAESLNNPFFESELPKELKEQAEKELKEAREKKAKEFNAICDEELKRFESSALGSLYFYDASLKDQVNLIELVLSNAGAPLRCYKESSPKQNIPHTKEQLKQVFNDAVTHKTNAIYKCGALKSYLNELTNIEDINNLSTEDYKRILQKDSDTARNS